MFHRLGRFGRRLAWLAPLLVVSQAWAPGDGNDLIPDIPQGPHTVELAVLVDVGDLITDISNAGDGSGRLFFVSPRGVIRRDSHTRSWRASSAPSNPCRW